MSIKIILDVHDQCHWHVCVIYQVLNLKDNIKSKLKLLAKMSSTTFCFFYSAGVGRTGTLIAIDIALSQASKEKQVDIPKIIVDMRKQRMKMVQTVVCEIII